MRASSSSSSETTLCAILDRPTRQTPIWRKQQAHESARAPSVEAQRANSAAETAAYVPSDALLVSQAQGVLSGDSDQHRRRRHPGEGGGTLLP